MRETVEASINVLSRNEGTIMVWQDLSAQVQAIQVLRTHGHSVQLLQEAIHEGELDVRLFQS